MGTTIQPSKFAEMVDHLVDIGMFDVYARAISGPGCHAVRTGPGYREGTANNLCGDLGRPDSHHFEAWREKNGVTVIFHTLPHDMACSSYNRDPLEGKS
jgi:hypothetical protein